MTQIYFQLNIPWTSLDTFENDRTAASVPERKSLGAIRAPRTHWTKSLLFIYSLDWSSQEVVYDMLEVKDSCSIFAFCTSQKMADTYFRGFTCGDYLSLQDKQSENLKALVFQLLYLPKLLLASWQGHLTNFASLESYKPDSSRVALLYWQLLAMPSSLHASQNWVDI